VSGTKSELVDRLKESATSGEGDLCVVN